MKRKFKQSDRHQFQQYQQNKQSPLISTELTEHKKDHDIWCWKSSHGLSLEQAQNVVGLNRLMVSQPCPLDNLISNVNTYINKRLIKPTHILLDSKRPHTITQMNYNINMDSTIAGAMNARRQLITR